MIRNSVKVAFALAFAAATPVAFACDKCKSDREFHLFPRFMRTAWNDTFSGARCGKCKTASKGCKFGCNEKVVTAGCQTDTTANLPPNAVPGECYAKVWMPPQTKTVTERVCVKEAEEKIEIIPAQYEWVSEKVCVKEASKQLIEEPAQFESYEQTVVVEPGRTDWVRENSTNCTLTSDRSAANANNDIRDVFCLVNYPPLTKTITKQRMVKPASCHEVLIPAEYQTVQRQRLVCPAEVRKTIIPAEFDTVEKTVKVCDGYLKWERVVCDVRHNPNNPNANANLDSRTSNDSRIIEVKRALASAGYNPGPMNAEANEDYHEALTQFQEDNGLGAGELTYETVAKLGLSDTYLLTSGR